MGTPPLPSQFIRVAKKQFSQLIDMTTSLLLRERRIQLVVVAIVSIASGALAYSLNSSALAARQQWTSNFTVLVTTTRLARGDILTTSNTRAVQLPVAAIAADALAVIPRNARVRLPVAANTPLTQSLVDKGNSTLSIPEGWRGVALPRDTVTPLVDVGDRVDVISNNLVISKNALVIEVGDNRGITIAVPVDDAPVVASASLSGDVSLVFLNH